MRGKNTNRKKTPMKKPTVLFPYVEAGMGHIVPMKAIARKFKELYGEKVNCREISFYLASGIVELIEFENRMKKSVVKQNRRRAFGFFMTANMNFFGAKISTAASARLLKRGAAKEAVKHMNALAPNLVVSTHWSTNYFAGKCEQKPLTVLYCPDTRLYPLFEYPCDLTLVPTRFGYEEALKKHKRRYNADNLRCVTALIGEEAFAVPRDKRALRAALGLAPDKFTVLLAEGGYGIGKSGEISRLIIERGLPVNLVVACGKNERLFAELSQLNTGKNCRLYPLGYTERMQEYIAAADLFCGKGGANTLSEATFAGVPQIVTNYASGVEKLNGEYYVKEIKTALKIFKPEKVVNAVERFIRNPSELEPFRAAAENQRQNYGAEQSARLIFGLLCTRFPELV